MIVFVPSTGGKQMRRKKLREVPAHLSRLEKRLTAWRKTRTPGQRIPKSIWKSAAKLATEYGLSKTAVALKLNYEGLRKHAEQANAESPSTIPFVELSASSFPIASECMIEWEDVDGAIMRMHLKGGEVPDALALGRGFWSTDG
jgi:hypothetical protein